MADADEAALLRATLREVRSDLVKLYASLPPGLDFYLGKIRLTRLRIDAALGDSAFPAPEQQAPAEAFTEYGYCVEYANGRRCDISPLGTDKASAWATLANYAEADQCSLARATRLTRDCYGRLILASRDVTRTAWTDVDAQEANDG